MRTYSGPLRRWVELGVLDEGLAQLAGGLDPVGVGRQEHAARADAVHLRIVDAWWRHAVVHVRLDRGDQPAADADDHRVGRAQVLARCGRRSGPCCRSWPRPAWRCR